MLGYVLISLHILLPARWQVAYYVAAQAQIVADDNLWSAVLENSTQIVAGDKMYKGDKKSVAQQGFWVKI